MSYLQQTNNNITFTNNLFNSYVDYIEVKETTLKGYIVGLKNFAYWLAKEGIEQPTREDIKKYKKYLDDECNYSNGTQAYYLRTIKQFFSWCESEGLYSNIAVNIKGVKVDPTNTKKESFNEEDIRTILNSINRTTEEGKRNYLIILLCVVGGLRTIELVRADIQDLATIKGQKVLYIQGKGKNAKDNYIKIPNLVEQALEDYLATRTNLRPNAPLLVGTSNRSAERLHIKSLSRIIKTILRKSGYDSTRLTAHSLRHTSNTLLFKSGADLYQVQKHARHSNPSTTEIYLHSYQRELDNSEEDIIKQIFKEEKQELTPTEVLANLDKESLAKVLEFAKGLQLQTA